VTRTQRQIEAHRQGEACVEVRDAAGRPLASVPIWVEQEAHAFPFVCVAPDLTGVPEPDRERCAVRLGEVFNRLSHRDESIVPGGIRVPVPPNVHLGRFRLELDRLGSEDGPLVVHATGRSVGLRSDATAEQERAAAERATELYTLCFAHPAVRAIVWDGFWDGEECAEGGGLLRRDFAPRPAFQYLHKLIGTLWHTRAAGETDREGRFRFRGFFGDYRAAARAGEEAATTGLFSLRAGGEGSAFRLRAEPGSEW
jgi:hypothetical protein